MLLGRIGLFSSFLEQLAFVVDTFFDRTCFYEFFGSGGPLECEGTIWKSADFGARMYPLLWRDFLRGNT